MVFSLTLVTCLFPFVFFPLFFPISFLFLSYFFPIFFLFFSYFFPIFFTDEASSGYFYTNDLKVLVDIFIREITNLDTKDVMRTDYLITLSLLLNRSTWVEHGRYRRVEIIHCLECILDVGGDGVDGYDEAALETVEIVLGECQTILEE